MRKNSMKTMTFMIAIWIAFLLVMAHDIYKELIYISVPTNLTFKVIEDFMGKDHLSD